MAKFSKETDKQMEELALTGMGYKEIATQFNCSRNTVAMRLSRAGFRKRQPYNKSISDELKTKIIEMRSRSQPLSYMNIQKELGVSGNASRDIWIKHLNSLKIRVSEPPIRALMRSVDAQAKRYIRNWSVGG